MRKILSWSLAVGGLLLVYSESMAAGRVFIQPRIAVYVENNANFYRTETGEASVNTYGVEPGVKMLYKTAKTKVAADAAVDIRNYDSDDAAPAGYQEADDYNYTGLKGDLAVSHDLTERLTLGVDDTLRVTRDPEFVDQYSNSVGRGKYTTNTFSPNVYYDFGNKFGVGGKYQNVVINYSDEEEDFTENRGVVDLFYNLNRSTAVYFDYQLSDGSYDSFSSDYTTHEASLNFSKSFNFFTFTAGAGYYNRSFDSNGLDDIDGVLWSIVVEGKDRSEEDSLKPRRTVRIALTHDLNSYGSGDSYYAATQLEIKGGYMFTEKLGVSGLFLFQNSDYEINPSDREDDLLVVSGRIGYQVLPFMNLSLEAGYRDRDSNTDGYSYDDTFVMARSEFTYDIGHQ